MLEFLNYISEFIFGVLQNEFVLEDGLGPGADELVLLEHLLQQVSELFVLEQAVVVRFVQEIINVFKQFLLVMNCTLNVVFFRGDTVLVAAEYASFDQLAIQRFAYALHWQLKRQGHARHYLIYNDSEREHIDGHARLNKIDPAVQAKMLILFVSALALRLNQVIQKVTR